MEKVWSCEGALDRLMSVEPLHAIVWPLREGSVTARVAAAFALCLGRIRHTSDLERLAGKSWPERLGVSSDRMTALLSADMSDHSRTVTFLSLVGVTRCDLERLPSAAALSLLDSFCAQKLDNDCMKFSPSARNMFRTVPSLTERENLVRLRWPKDLRLDQVRRMLDSSKMIRIPLVQQASENDLDFRDRQEAYLYGVCVRNSALPFGRAILEYKTRYPLVTEIIQIPALSSTGRAVGRNVTIELKNIDIPNKAIEWANFHNGVAAGLATCYGAQTAIDSTWISLNLPKTETNISASDAGLLLAFGLNGHLNRTNLFNIHEYLAKGDMLTSVAVLLGIAASQRASADLQVYKMLATHLPFLLPPTLLELQIDSTVQTAAVTGVGLVYSGTGHSGIAQALLKQMIKVPTGDGEPNPERESYVLACGLAIGMVSLGEGDSINASCCPFAEERPSMADRLLVLIEGGQKCPDLIDPHDQDMEMWEEMGSRDDDHQQSYHVREGNRVNVHVTAPGATLALGLMFLKTGNKSIAQMLNVPQTLTLLDRVRPDFLLLRTLSRSLILWSEIVPSMDWVMQQIPEVVRRFTSKVTSVTSEMDDGERQDWWQDMVDEQSVCQAYCYVVAGSCFAIALRFAGSANNSAFQTLIHYCRLFLPVADKDPSTLKLLDFAGKHAANVCLNTIVWSLGILMAGSGNVDVLRLGRFLARKYSGEKARKSIYVHGVQMTAHMTMAMLFMANGRYTLSTSKAAVAALVCSMYPVFPAHGADNRRYLQTLRHLWVLAVEPRLFCPVDSGTFQYAVANLNVHLKATDNYEAEIVQLRTPCVLPELDLISRLELVDQRYFPLLFQLDKTPVLNRLLTILTDQYGRTELKRRAASLADSQDIAVSQLSDVRVGAQWRPVTSTGQFCSETPFCASLRRWCRDSECLEAFPILTQLFSAVSDKLTLGAHSVTQVKLLKSYYKWKGCSATVICRDLIEQLESSIETILWENVDQTQLRSYVNGQPISGEVDPLLGAFLVYYEIPSAKDLKHLFDSSTIVDISSLEAKLQAALQDSFFHWRTFFALKTIFNLQS